MHWTDAQQAQLIELYPHKSASQIAAILNTTRNAVCGRANRIGLSKGHKWQADRPARMPKPRKERVAKPVRGPTMKRLKPLPVCIAVSTEPQGPGISFDMLKSPHCRYAVNEEHPFLFCGEVKKEGSSYCEFHADLCRDKSR